MRTRNELRRALLRSKQPGVCVSSANRPWKSIVKTPLPAPALLLSSLIAGVILPPAAAQEFGVGVTAAPTPLQVNAAFTYSIEVTNISGVTQSAIFVTNTISSSVTVLGATNLFGTADVLTGNRVVFGVESMTNDTRVSFSIGARPTAAGRITNAVVARTFFGGIGTNTLVSDVFAGQADLGVTLTGPTSGVLPNDWVTYQLGVTNAGPATASGVVLSNQLPADVVLISVNPGGYTFANQLLRFNLGALAGGASRTFEVRVQPTNAGTASFTAGVHATGAVETNSANNTATLEMIVDSFLPGDLIATNFTGQTYNPQTGLMEQWIRLVNVGENEVPAARVVVGGLTNRLFNAVGTNDGKPFVLYANTLPAGESRDLLLEYFIPTRTAGPDPVLTAVAVPLPAITVPATTPPNILKVLATPSGGVLIEFQSTPGRSYTVVYSDSSDFSNPLAAQPHVVAPADRVQWIDEGPPKTISRPADAASRFYRVVENP